MLWDQTTQLPREQFALVQQVYSGPFPLEVRLQLAAWIEEKFIPQGTAIEPPVFDINAPQHQQMAAVFANELLEQLEHKILTMPNDPDKILVRTKLQESADGLRCTFSNNPTGLYMAVRDCLEKEMSIVSQVPEVAFPAADIDGSPSGGVASSVGSLSSEEEVKNNSIKQQLSVLKQRVTESGNQLDHCRQGQEAFFVEFYSYKERSSRYEALLQEHGEQNQNVARLKLEIDALNRSIKQKYGTMKTRQSDLLNFLVELCTNVAALQSVVLDQELISWKRDQKLAGNGYPLDNRKLDRLQEWCEGLADVIWTMRQQVRQFEGLRAKMTHDPQHDNTVNIQALLAKITELLSNLVTGTFVIEKQPPQVMKTNTRFTATVRLLVGGVLNVHMEAPAVSVSIVNEHLANQLLGSPSRNPKKKEDFSSGDILNNQGAMEYHAATRQVSCSFRNLQLKKIKRTEKKGQESVMDEKFSVLFWTEFQVSELKFQLWTFSLPVVVIVHGNQEPQALSTVVWDNGFAEWGRKAFVVTDKVEWGQMGTVLNMKWQAACGRGLTEENLYYLACKALRNNALPRAPDEYNKMTLTWSLFCKELLPDRTFTFWEWFYRALLLTSNHMHSLWKEGHVMGFVMKQAAEQMLMQKPVGTFLLRFSDSELGGVSISVKQQGQGGFQDASISSLYPFSTRDLSQRSMADTVFDIKFLIYVYPDTLKENLRKFCSASNQGAAAPQTTNGYVRHQLVTQVEGSENEPAASTSGAYDVGAFSPVSGFEDVMDIPDFDFAEQIDVRQILALTEDQFPACGGGGGGGPTTQDYSNMM